MESTIIGVMDRSIDLFIAGDNLDRLVKGWAVWKENGVIDSVIDAVIGQIWSYLENQWALLHSNHVTPDQEREFTNWMRRNSYLIRSKVELACER